MCYHLIESFVHKLVPIVPQVPGVEYTDIRRLLVIVFQGGCKRGEKAYVAFGKLLPDPVCPELGDQMQGVDDYCSASR
jgi:hypothetical protein